MTLVKLDTTGLRCPEPVLKIAAKLMDMKPGDVLEVIGDCSTFERDVRNWCKRMKKTLLFVKDEGAGRINCQIQF